MLTRRSVLRNDDGILPDDVIECLEKTLRRDFAWRIVKLWINLRSKQFRMIRNNAPAVVAYISELFFCLFKYGLVLIFFLVLLCVFTREKGWSNQSIRMIQDILGIVLTLLMNLDSLPSSLSWSTVSELSFALLYYVVNEDTLIKTPIERQVDGKLFRSSQRDSGKI